ncbi:hypothetical protein [Streptomyces lydicus]|uniref:hypothetical protein n=1 Tax=Streptomyces lydicus TaxID=47763 RepID=UPI00378BEF3D
MPPKKRRDYEATRALVTEAVETLRKTKKTEELADAVAWTLTDEYIAAAVYRQHNVKNPTLPIASTETERTHLKNAAAAAGNTLTADAEEAFRAFLAGTFTPTKPQRKGWGTSEPQKNINVRPDKELHAAAKAHGEALADELGWKPTPASIVIQHLRRKYPLPEPPAGE